MAGQLQEMPSHPPLQSSQHPSLSSQRIPYSTPSIPSIPTDPIIEYHDFEENRLNFEVSGSDGGEFSADYAASNMLRNDTSCYCSTRRSNVNVVLKFKPQDPRHQDFSFTLTQSIVKAPLTGFTSPVKEVLIFVSHHPPDVEATKKYDGITQSEFLQLLRRRKEDQTGPKEDDPAAFISMVKGVPFVLHDFLPFRTGKYILVKFLSSDGYEENIDCQFVGFMGFVGKRAFPEASFL